MQQPNAAPASSSGTTATTHQDTALSTASGIWSLDRNARKATWAGWEAAITAEGAKRVAKKVTSHDMYARQLSNLQLQKDRQRLRGARVIGCTTTGAAIHGAILAEAGCGVVLVEEAAEVLEAHVLAALDDSTKHLIMIGEDDLQWGQGLFSVLVSSREDAVLRVSATDKLYFPVVRISARAAAVCYLRSRN